MSGMRLYVLDNGPMKMDKNLMIAGSVVASASNPNRPNEYIEFPVYTVLIDHPEGRILFDTACNPNAMGKGGRWSEATQDLFPYLGSAERTESPLLARILGL